jgi:hypothetical protein
VAGPLPTGTFEFPEGWETRLRVDVLEPAGETSPSGPRSNLVVSRRRTRKSLKEEIDHFRAGLEQNVQGIKLLPTERFKFADGASGFRLEIVLPSTPPAFQQQIFRLDDGLLTLFTVTCPKDERGRAGELVSMVKSFRP